jgi:hypothetical protein
MTNLRISRFFHDEQSSGRFLQDCNHTEMRHELYMFRRDQFCAVLYRFSQRETTVAFSVRESEPVAEGIHYSADPFGTQVYFTSSLTSYVSTCFISFEKTN